MNKIVVAIDGFSSCGKSTMAKDLAKKIGYLHIDSGAMYRAVTLYALQNGMINEGKIDETKLQQNLTNIQISFKLNEWTQNPDTYLNGICVEDEIRTMEVSNYVSPISALAFVREAMVKEQQLLGLEKGIVMDGRDIGTTVFPNAELKIFVTASPEVRAKRRLDELHCKGDNATFDEVLENVVNRDFMDQNRTESPLRMAKDALLLDNSYLSIEDQDKWLFDKYLDAAK